MNLRLFALSTLFAAVGAANALTITVSGTGSGTLGNTLFTGAAFTFTLTTDTTLRQKPPCCQTVDTQPPTPTTFSIAGAGSGTFTDNQIVFAYPLQAVVGFAHFNDGDLVDLDDPKFSGYDMTTSLGPISGVPSFVGGCPGRDCATFSTSAGMLSFNDIRTVTFTFVVSTKGSTPSSITLAPSANPSNFGKPVTISATVTPASATGKVTFFDGASVLGVATLSVGKAALTTPLLPAGVRSLKALYQGDTTYRASSSTAVLQKVQPLPQQGFQAPTSVSGVSFPRSVVVADFNADGRPDLAAGDFDINRLSVLLGNGDGTFSTTTGYATPAGPTDIVAADFNGDGRTDIAVANGATPSNSVSVFLGNGNGTFQGPVNYSVGDPNTLVNPNKLVAGDFNGDGVVDIATANFSDNTVSVLLGKGDGTFLAPVKSPAGTGPIAMAMADFNGDGRPDLVLAVGASVNVLLGKGDGTFLSPVSYSAGLNPKFVVVDDFNGDGQPDLAVANGGNDTVSVLLGNSNGTFRAAVNYAAPKGIQALASGDFNGDGRTDLAVADSGSNTVNVLAGNGDGTFQAAVSYPGGPAPLFLAEGDFNRDGLSDIVVANFQSTSVSILLGLAPPAMPSATLTLVSPPGDRIHVGDSLVYQLTVVNPGAAGITGLGFTESTSTGGISFDLPTDGSCTQVESGIDCTGLADLGPNSTRTIALTATATAAGQVTSGLTVRYNVPPQTIATQEVTINVQSAAGQPVFAPVSVPWRSGFAPNTAAVLPDSVVTTDWAIPANPGVSGGVFSVTAADGRATQLGLPNPIFPVLSLAGDFDGTGGVNDLAILDSAQSAVILLLNVTGGQNPSVGTVLSWTGFAAAGVAPPSMAMFKDAITGFTDLAILASPSDVTQRGQIVVATNDGRGNLGNAISYDASPTAGNLIAVDVNNDGFQDLLFIDPAGNSVGVMLNNAANQFGAPLLTPLGDAPGIAMLAGDFNGDGFADLAVLTPSGLNIYLGNGYGSFTPAVTLPLPDPGPVSGLQPGLLAAADFNGDGNLDICVASPASNLLTIFPGDGQGNFGTPALYLSLNPIGLAAGFAREATTATLAVIGGLPGQLSILTGK